MRTLLLLKSALFTVFVPGVAAIFIPYRLASRAGLLVFPRLGLSTAPAYLLLCIGVLIYLRCAWDFAVRGLGTPAPLDPPKTLVVSGLYRWSRNPMYNGVLVVVLSIAWLSGSSTLLIYAACLFLVFHLFVVLYEEPHLRQVFGAPYAGYCTAVPRWGAAFRPYHPVSEGRVTQGSFRVPTGTTVDWRGVRIYLALAFGLAWTVEGTALARGVRFTSLTPRTTAILASVMFAPALAAFIVRRFITREGFATAGLRLGPWRPYLVVWMGVPLLIAGIYALTLLFGLGRFDPTLEHLFARMREMAHGQPIPALPPPPAFAAILLAQGLTLGVLVASVFTFGEEFGWTGYLLVRLLPLGRWRAALIYGALWGLWHAPLIVGGYNYPSYPVIGVGMMCCLTIAFALTQTALRLRSDSVLLTSFFHASVNTQGLGIFSMLVAGVSPILGGVTGAVGIVTFLALGAWFLARTPESLARRVISG